MSFRYPIAFASTVLVIEACASSSNETAPAADAGPGSTDATSSTDRSSSDAATPPTGVFSFVAKTDSPAPPDGSTVVVAWSVFAGSPDYTYVFGGGTTAGSDVLVSLNAAPPSEALNEDKLGIGILIVYPAGTPIEAGKQPSGGTRDAGGSAPLAIAPGHFVVFRKTSEQVTSDGWDVSFPQGYACARCEDRETGFDALIVEDCAKVKLLPYSSGMKLCNFT